MEIRWHDSGDIIGEPYYLVRREDGFVVSVSTLRIVDNPRIAAAISDNPSAWNAIEVDEFPKGWSGW